MFSRPIAIGLSPNTEGDDVFLALQTFLQPWKWKKGIAIKKVEQWFKDYFPQSFALSFNSGRSALYVVLKSLDITSKDEVLLQSFTCVAVPNAVLWNSAKPVYVDVDDSLNIDPKDLEKKITKKSKVIIVQHTFGVPAQMNKIMDIARKHNLFVVEDCAHALGAIYEGKKVGTFGDAAIFSFGRDKVISSVFGGIAITRDEALADRLVGFHEELSLPSRRWIMQQLLHPIFFSIILPLYHFFNIGKIILFISQKFNILSFPVFDEEKKGNQPSIFPQQYVNALAVLALNQLQKLDVFNARRQKYAQQYKKAFEFSNLVTVPKSTKGSNYLRFNVFVSNPQDIFKKVKKKKILLGNWYSECIAPRGVDKEKIAFVIQDTPKAAYVAEKSLNLPTYPSMTEKDVQKVINVIKKVL